MDTHDWVAITNPRDQWHPAVMNASRHLAGCHLVTTDEVLTEFLTAFCEAGTMLRRRSALLVRDLYNDQTMTIHHQTRLTFLADLDVYEARPDKEYSLTDCISMQAMQADGITEVLTHDRHFTQERFTILL